MHKNSLAFVLLAGALLLAACGSPTPTPAPTEAPMPVEPPAEPATQLEATATTEAPATATTAPQGAAPTRVVVLLADNTIQASLSTFQAGVPYTFVIKNNGMHEHKFSINAPVSLAGSLAAAEDAALLAIGTDQLGAGDSVTVDFTFPASAVGAQLELACLIRRHYDDGMFQAITVTS